MTDDAWFVITTATPCSSAMRCSLRKYRFNASVISATARANNTKAFTVAMLGPALADALQVLPWTIRKDLEALFDAMQQVSWPAQDRNAALDRIAKSLAVHSHVSLLLHACHCNRFGRDPWHCQRSTLPRSRKFFANPPDLSVSTQTAWKSIGSPVRLTWLTWPTISRGSYHFLKLHDTFPICIREVFENVVWSFLTQNLLTKTMT